MTRPERLMLARLLAGRGLLVHEIRSVITLTEASGGHEVTDEEWAEIVVYLRDPAGQGDPG